MTESNLTKYKIAKGLSNTIVKMILDVIPLFKNSEGNASAAVCEAITNTADSLIDPIMQANSAVEALEMDKLLTEIAGWAKIDSEYARESAKNGVYFDAAQKSAICDGYQRVVMLINRQFGLDGDKKSDE